VYIKYMTDRAKKRRDAWRKTNNCKLLATEVFHQATGVTSERGSVQVAHDRASKETLGRMAEN